MEESWRGLVKELAGKVGEIPAILDAETLAKLPTHEISS